MSEEKKLNFFDIVNNICSSNKPLTWDEMASAYNSFMINKALGNNKDTILLANELNQKHWITKEMHYDFLFHVIPKKKRYGKWNKNSDDKENIELIMEYYDYSYTRAKEVLDLVDIDAIKNELNRGGKSGKIKNDNVKRKGKIK
ncbi:MAG: DNA polymerase clamp loader subunit A [Flavobacterium sp.]|uniref:DNA polymerase clamp loader subunit A n=1 Tax=Flavobacterium sp. TaxID=239 RepID=UPI00260F4F12|nr:DNA polymerase clamp loader subunit A [Flavobacterium sp.]MDD5150430.1 DNA polymerase clamp loader subunit A [Flavobacterium sp.]